MSQDLRTKKLHTNSKVYELQMLDTYLKILEIFRTSIKAGPFI